MAELTSEHQNAASIASLAGEALLAWRAQADKATDVHTIRAKADKLSHKLIIQQLAKLYPEDPVLSEEGEDNKARLSSQRVWIVDPLDGTREFGEYERDDWAVHVALVINGEPLVAAVALPALHITLSTISTFSPFAQINRPLRMVVSKTRPPQIALHVAEKLGAQLTKMGSAGAKAMAVVRNEADIYLHSGGQYEWDSAAPVGVALAAGLHASRIDGTPLQYNQANPWLPDLLICRPELARQVLQEIASFSV